MAKQSGLNSPTGTPNSRWNSCGRSSGRNTGSNRLGGRQLQFEDAGALAMVRTASRYFEIPWRIPRVRSDTLPDMGDTDMELLARYTREGAEDAFAELVRRHLG